MSKNLKASGSQNFVRVVFWCIVVFAILVLLHFALILMFYLSSRHPPDVLLFPRLEMAVSLLFIPPLAGASAALFNNLKLIPVGVIVILFGPACIAIYYHTYIWYNLVFKPPQ